MATWEKAILTKKGLDLMAKLAAGNTLSLARAVAGTGSVDPAELCDLTAIAGENIEMTFATIKYLGDGRCSVPVRLSNAAINSTVTVNQIGVMAIDPDEGEILYMISQSTDGKGTEIPSSKDVPSYKAGWNFVMNYGMADGVTVVVDPAGTVSREEVETILDARIQTINVEISQLKKELESILDGNKESITEEIKQVKEDLSQKAPIHAVAYGITTEGDGAAYTATVEGITSLAAGATFMMIPHVVSAAKVPTLNVNGLGAKSLRRRVSNSTVTTVAANVENWLAAGKPIRVFFDGTHWIADFTRPNANDIYGTVDIASGGTGAATPEAARANLGAAERKILTATIGTEWTGAAAPYTQKVAVAEILSTDAPHIFPVYSDALATALAEKEAWSMVDKATTGNGTITFTCFEEKPEAAIQIQIEVIR